MNAQTSALVTKMLPHLHGVLRRHLETLILIIPVCWRTLDSATKLMSTYGWNPILDFLRIESMQYARNRMQFRLVQMMTPLVNVLLNEIPASVRLALIVAHAPAFVLIPVVYDFQ
jgi:hypothetical protein